MLHRARPSLAFLLLVLTALPAAAQEEPSPEADPVSKQATQLEAELGKYKDTAPQAGDAMAELVDLYHEHGRVFGLVRVGQRFIASHTGDPRHQTVMLKLLDGLEIAARNEDFVQTARQFLARYPKAPQCPDLEIRLANVLDQTSDHQAAAEAHRTVYLRQPKSEPGRKHALKAMRRFAEAGNEKVYLQGAELGERMLDTLPKSQAAEEIGWQAFAQYRRGSEWARANVVGTKLLKKGLPQGQDRQRQLHLWMGENYGRQGQWANAAKSYARARQIRDGRDAHYELIRAQYQNATAKASELAPLVADYARKYPQREDRFYLQSLLALKHEREGNRQEAHRLFAQLLPHDARSNNAASAFVRTADTENPNHAALEKTLRNAISRNPHRDDQAYLRYVLAFQVCRDRMEDPGKAKSVLRNLITQSPSDDNYSRTAVSWLLYNAESDQEFRADVDRILKSRQQHLHLSSFRGALSNWYEDARRRKEHRERAAWLKPRLDKANADPLYRTWVNARPYNGDGDTAREALIAMPQFDKLDDELVRYQLSRRAYYLRHRSPGSQRKRSVAAYGMLAQRFPKDYDAAVSWLSASTDYGPKEVAREAALHLLKFDPPSNNPDVFRRLVQAADQNEDADLLGRAFAWIQNAEKKHGLAVTYAYVVGDTLAKYEREEDAVAYWRAHVPVDRNHYDSMYCAQRVAERLEGDAWTKYVQELHSHECDYHGRYATWLADAALEAGDLDRFETLLRTTKERQQKRPFRGWGLDGGTVQDWVDSYRSNEEASEEDARRVFTAVRDLDYSRPSATATLALLELPAEQPRPVVEKLLVYHRVTQSVGNGSNDWDSLVPYVQSALGREDYVAAATLAAGMLANIPSVNDSRKETGRELVSQSYARMGAVGLTIDEDSPIAPLLRASLSLRLGDEQLAWETYLDNEELFDEHRNQVPVDLVLFVCERLVAAGGDANHERVENVLRGWLVEFSESNQFDDQTKARVQLMLARNFAKARRYDVARSEYTTVLNRYPDTPEALEAEFGIGETFLAQKVYDQAERVFEKLANRPETDVVVRAEFLRGVLSHRRGDRDEAREIFRSVLERVPNVQLANQALFNLAEVYGDEERYVDQLNLLRTVGRLGRSSKRTHTPGLDLSIVVQDSDLGISRGHNRIPVVVKTVPGGDVEDVFLVSGGAGKGLFRTDLPTRLGDVRQGDGVLQITGRDSITCDYPEEFKQEFRRVPLSDVDIVVASDAKFDVASSLVVDEDEVSFSERLRREAEKQQDDERVSQQRPANQIKPGNRIYLRVKDADRDLSDAFDEVVVKLAAESGDELQVTLTETEPHSGVFEGIAATGELPAGALASDTAIEHSPLMAIDRDPGSYWMSEPDGATPKQLTIDMKDLKIVSRVVVSSPEADRHAPVRGELLGSDDGRFWYHLAGNPPQREAAPVADESGPMALRLYSTNASRYDEWRDVVSLARNSTPFAEEEGVTELSWKRPENPDDPEAQNAGFTAIWHGKLVQEREGAARINVTGTRSAVAIDGRQELPVGPGNRSVDVWLEAGTHDLTIFAATNNGATGVQATIAHADHDSAQVQARPFRAADFDLTLPYAQPAPVRPAPQADFGPAEWTLQFAPRPLRYVRFRVDEYLGPAVAVSNVQVHGEDGEVYIPTQADVLALAQNDELEIAGGDVVTATYTDERTEREDASSRLLTGKLTATYYDAEVAPIAWDIVKQAGGGVSTIRKRLMRIDPGERIVVEIVDFDNDRTENPDEITFDVFVNDGEPIEMTATETDAYTGVFTKEIDTSAEEEEGKLQVEPGDRVYLRYIDLQNTFPGHAVPRESVVYVNQPSEARVRILETRVAPAENENARPQVEVLPPAEDAEISRVAFDAPLTVEVVDPDRAKTDRSTVTVTLTTTDGATVDVECEISNAFSSLPSGVDELFALEQGRFVGQVVMQLGSKESPTLVPVSSDMPRNLVGGPKLNEDEENGSALDRTLVTRVLNLTGKDRIAAIYHDELRPGGDALDRRAQARLVSTGSLVVTDRHYENEIERLHVGEKLFLMVTDPDRDASDERDTIDVEITTEFGEQETVSLAETLVHSGVFTGSLTLTPDDEPTPGNLDPQEPALECYFGDTLHLKYVDTAAATPDGRLELVRNVPVVIGTDGLVSAFSKTFQDEELAVETKFHIAESYFELFKSHKDLGRDDEQQADLEAGRRVLREVMADYPDPRYVPRVAYLLGQFSQELEQWAEAIEAYSMIVRQYPEHALAPDAQYKLAQCYELSGDFDEALEAYVTLAATYPKNPLIANVMIRISDHFYKKEQYEVAAQVGEKFLERFDSHEYASRIAFRIGQCFYKSEQFQEAGEAFDRFTERFPNDDLSADAMFWAGESYRQGNDNRQAFIRYNNARWKYPASEAAKYARGRLALPEMLQQFQAEAQSVEDDE